jgi:ankyrin repeat protein
LIDILDYTNGEGRSLFAIAKESGNAQIIRFLIENGARITKDEEDGSQSQSNVLNELTPYIDLFKAAKEGSIEKTKKILEKGVSLNARNKKGQTALEIANNNGRKGQLITLLTPALKKYEN